MRMDAEQIARVALALGVASGSDPDDLTTVIADHCPALTGDCQSDGYLALAAFCYRKQYGLTTTITLRQGFALGMFYAACQVAAHEIMNTGPTGPTDPAA